MDTEKSFVDVRVVCKNPSNAQAISKMKKKVFSTIVCKIVCKSLVLKMPIIFLEEKVKQFSI